MAITGVMFQNTTGAELSIQDIRLSEDLPADGGTYMMYWIGHWEQPSWVCLLDDQGNPLPGDPIGWGDTDWKEVSKTFSLGEAFFLCPAASEDVTKAAVTVSGQVYSCPEQYGAIALTKGSMDFISPVFPTSTYSIQSIRMCDDVPADGGTYLMYWEGHWEQPSWVCFLDDQGNPLPGDPIGWGDTDWKEVSKTFRAGEGFFGCAAGDLEGDSDILFPNPLFKAE